jgi:aminopeptidase N
MARVSSILSVALAAVTVVSCVSCVSCAEPAPPPAAAPMATAPLPPAPLAPPPAPPTLRLPTTVRPLRYDLDLTLVPSQADFAGVIGADVLLAEATRVVWLNATDLTVQEAKITAGAETHAAQAIPGGEDFIGLLLDAPVGPGPARITVAYRGLLDKEKSRGLYRQSEGPGDDDGYIYSFFEPIDARRAFPCFDEPNDKVPWKLTLHVKKGHVALANTQVASEKDEAGGMKAVAFEETKPLPSYLVALIVGPFDLVTAGTAGHHGTPLRFAVPRGRGGETRYAAEVTPRIIGLLEDYFGMPYPYGKLDVAVVPRYWGTMEHPGLVALGQPLTLIKPDEETLERKQAYADIAAHELAHYWFGDYVTNAWWDETWLNEALAQWMDARITDALEPSWRFGLRRLERTAHAMNSDALANAKRIRQPVLSKHDIADAFDGGVTYDKGAAVIDMFAAWIGPEVFQRGIRRYMSEHAWGNAVADDLLGALSAEAGKDIAPAFKTFLDQPGLPLVSVEPICASGAAPKLGITQKRFVPAGSAEVAGTSWQFPVCARYGAGTSVGHVCTLLTTPAAEVALEGAKSCPEWVMQNQDALGYYRSAYDPRALARLIKAKNQLSVAERVSLLGDALALTRTGALPLGDALGLVPPLIEGGDRLLLERGSAIVRSARPDLLPPAERARLARFVQKTFGKRARALGWKATPGEGPDAALLRPELLELVIDFGEDVALRKEAHDLAWKWLDDRHALDPDLVGPALFFAGKSNDRKLFDRLRATLRSATLRREREQLASALGSFSDPPTLREGLGLVLSDELDLRESINILRSAMYSSETRDLAYVFLKESFGALVKKMRSDEAAELLMMSSFFCDERHRADAGAFFGPRAAQIEGGPRIFANALERVDQCIASAKLNRKSLEAFLEKL